MLYMCDVLQLVVDSLNDYPFVQQNLPLHAHEHVHYIVTHQCDKLYSINEEHLEKDPCRYIPGRRRACPRNPALSARS